MKYNSILEGRFKFKEQSDKFFKGNKTKGKKLDDQFHTAHQKVFQKIDCLECANCCKTTSPIFRDVDIKRISKGLKITEKQFVANYLHMDEDQDYVLNQAPCLFLNLETNKCDIYEFRPLACKEYPHTDRKNMHQILNLTKKNMEICPAVCEIVGTIIGASIQK